ncbi:GDP-mannose transporter GONST4 [Dichanthelium oligosanthes]|uniref:GDP-mannose transporter GONST4 n=1 Tax=Dichanthelium oligosanthes TaxID=888268 RepID=A0A1E5VJJ4_9POAL|nr:GDP-mannose transporter GONST4 [Dichanthelium oligosanthes]
MLPCNEPKDGGQHQCQKVVVEHKAPSVQPQVCHNVLDIHHFSCYGNQICKCP